MERSPVKPAQRPWGVAVQYVNMLPYFAEDPGVLLCPSPAQANASLETCPLPVCTSLAAGLSRGWVPLGGKSVLGVGAAGLLESVYAETPPSARGQGFEEFAAGRPADGLSICLLVTGESAQTLWMFRHLCALARVPLRTVTLPSPSCLVLPWTALLANLPLAPGEVPCLLAVGDGALLRLWGGVEDAGDRAFLPPLWRAYTGLPAVFAVWFEPGTQRAWDRPEAALGRWEGLTQAQRKARIRSFLALSPRWSRLGLIQGYDSLLEGYVGRITYRFTDEFHASIAYQARLLAQSPTGLQPAGLQTARHDPGAGDGDEHKRTG